MITWEMLLGGFGFAVGLVLVAGMGAAWLVGVTSEWGA